VWFEVAVPDTSMATSQSVGGTTADGATYQFWASAALLQSAPTTEAAAAERPHRVVANPTLRHDERADKDIAAFHTFTRLVSDAGDRALAVW
jgi:hypothetical protein